MKETCRENGLGGKLIYFIFSLFEPLTILNLALEVVNKVVWKFKMLKLPVIPWKVSDYQTGVALMIVIDTIT